MKDAKRPRPQSPEDAQRPPPAINAPPTLPRALPFACRHVVGPMVGASDLAFRMLCRRHGADVCYTEMIFSQRLCDDDEYRERKLRTTAKDRPLVVQLQGNDPTVVARAAALVEATISSEGGLAIDLNLGCPLAQAEEGRFGSYLLSREHWPQVGAMIRAMVSAVSLPVCAKIRLLPSLNESIELCRMLTASGCSLIAIHARQRPPSGKHRGERHRCAADLNSVRDIVAALRPQTATTSCTNAAGCRIVSNGNTATPRDVARNLAYTRADGIMCAEGVLRDPTLFAAPADDAQDIGVDCTSWQGGGVDDREEVTEPCLPREKLGGVALEYLDLAREYEPEAMSVVRGHIMWLLGKSGKGHHCSFDHLGPYTPQQLRMALVEASSLDEFEQIVRAALQMEREMRQV